MTLNKEQNQNCIHQKTICLRIFIIPFTMLLILLIILPIEKDIKLSLVGYYFTGIIAFFIYLLQKRTTMRLEDLTIEQNQTTQDIKKLTEKINIATSYYDKIRADRVKYFQKSVITRLELIKEIYQGLLELMKNYYQHPDDENRKNLENYFKHGNEEEGVINPKTFIEAYSKAICNNINISAHFIENTTLIMKLENESLFFSHEFGSVQNFPYDTYEKKEKMTMSEITVETVPFESYIYLVDELINKINKHISEIKSLTNKP